MTLKVSSTHNLPEDNLKEIFEFLGTPALRRVCKQWQACLDARFATLFKLSPIVRDWTPLTLDLKTNSDVVMRTVQAVWKILNHSHRIRQEKYLMLEQASTLANRMKQTPLMLEKALTLEADSNLIIFFTAIRRSFPDGTATLTLTNDLSKDAAAIRTWMDSNQESLNTITFLNLQFFPLTALPPEIRLFTNLKRLCLSHTLLTSLPPWIGLFSHLQSLYLHHTPPFNSLPPEIGELKNLQSLRLDNTALKTLPPEIGKLILLEALDLSYTELKTLPPEIGLLTHLQHLDVSRTKLKMLPPEIGLLTHLQHFYLFNTPLNSLPPEIGRLTNLAFPPRITSPLPVTSLPPEIEQPTNLQIIGQNRWRLLQQLAEVSFMIGKTMIRSLLSMYPRTLNF